MDPLQQLLMLGQQRAQQRGIPFDPNQPQPGYPPLGQSLQPTPMLAQPVANNGVVPTTSRTNDVGQIIDENGNPLQSYARGEPAFGNASVGGSTAGAPGAAPAAPGAGAPGGQNRLLETLKGLAAPRPPDVVKPSTPHLPPLRPIEGGGLIQLMASLGIAPKDVPGLKQSIGR
jgi:hypothetical protein